MKRQIIDEANFNLGHLISDFIATVLQSIIKTVEQPKTNKESRQNNIGKNIFRK